MPSYATNLDFYKNVTTAGTPVVLSSTAILAGTVRLDGLKSSKTENTGPVYIRSVGGVGWLVLYPGSFVTYTTFNKLPYRIDLFEIDAANNGDGVYVTYQPHAGFDGNVS
jgi:hypothetical protein